VGLLGQIPVVGRFLRSHRLDALHGSPSRVRICRLEEVEPRCVMTAAVHVGAVYYDPASGLDTTPNQIQISFEGGAQGTELTHLTIDGNKDGGPLTFNDAIFDTAAGGLGAYGWSPLSIASHDGFQVLGSKVEDGGTQLTLDFAGFRAGMKLVLTIDVDQVLFIDAAGGSGDVQVDSVDEGAEFQRSHFVTTFAAPHFEDLTTSTLFWDSFDDNFRRADEQAATRLDLPPDRYTPDHDASVLTAGAVAVARQVPLPASLAGTVYYDANLDNTRASSESGIGGVTLSLDRYDGTQYVATQQFAMTDAAGHYRFDNLAPGTYRIHESQPAAYFSVGAKAGNVNGVTRGVVTSSDVVSEIALDGGDDDTDNDFAEALPNSLSGHVGLEVDGLCGTPNSPPIAGVVLQLLDDGGSVVSTTTTDSAGNYHFDGLWNGTYGIREIQPRGYFDADSHVGTAGGTASGNLVAQIVLTSGVDGADYDFCELPANSLRGHVGLAVDGLCGTSLTPPIAGVVIHLLDAQGNGIAATTTDSQGDYRFDSLAPGTYGIREEQPDGYFDAATHAGSAGGVVSQNLITTITLAGGIDAADYDFCELAPAQLCGYVYRDLNGNGHKDPQDPGIAGATLVLLDSAGRPTDLTAVTDASGFYCFASLRPGTYGVRESQPAGYFDGLDTAGSAGGLAQNPGDSILDIVLANGADAEDNDFGEIAPASLSGYVFQDGAAISVENPSDLPDVPALRDGQLTADDTRLPGVMLQLVDGVTGEPIDGSAALPGNYAYGQPIAVATDARGFYEFRGLKPGVYGVFVVEPSPYVPGIDTAGTTGGVVISQWNTVDSAVTDALVVKPTGDAIVRVSIASGQLSSANNFSVVQTTPQQPTVQVFVFPQSPTTVALVGPPAMIPSADVFAEQSTSPAMLLSPLVRATGGSQFTWHLSIVDAGQPRALDGDATSVQLTALRPAGPESWETDALSQGEWLLPGPDGQFRVRRVFGLRGGVPVTGDFNGDGKTDLGFFKDGRWYIDLNANGVWDAGDLWAQLGGEGDLPVTGDWDGDGKTDIGIYGRSWPRDPRAVANEPGLPDPHNRNLGQYKNIPRAAEKNAEGSRKLKLTAQGKSREDVVDHVFHFGLPGDRPVAGDWNGDGVHSIAVFREGRWHRDVDGDGQPSDRDLHHRLGRTGDLPIVGDFNGDGIDEIGVFRDGLWCVDTNGNGRIDGGDQVFRLGSAGDRPVVGDWDGDGKSGPGIYRDMPVVAAPPQSSAVK
jgi:serine-aspartate repeat-containing protein C/D/E